MNINSGFFIGEGVGCIGFDIVQVDGNIIFYVVIDNYGCCFVKEKEDELIKVELCIMFKEVFFEFLFY